MDESQQLIHTFLSTPDGKAIAAFHLPYDTPGNFPHMIELIGKIKKLISDHWGEIDLMSMADILSETRRHRNKRTIFENIPKGGFYLHFLPFLQGMLYVGNTGAIK